MISRTVISNIILSLWFFGDASRIFFFSGGNLTHLEVILIAAFLCFSWTLLFRQGAIASDASPRSVIIAVISTALPLSHQFFAAEYQCNHFEIALLQCISVMVFFASAVSLNTNFSILPNVRAITTIGSYMFIRHPIYLSYMIFDISFWYPSYTSPSFVVWVFEVILFYKRGIYEERLLLKHSEEYNIYYSRVKYGYIPGII